MRPKDINLNLQIPVQISMKFFLHITLLIAFSCGMSVNLLAQDQDAPEKTLIQIKNANRLRAIDNDSVDLKKLIGNVILEQEDIVFACDSAYLFESSNNIDAFGNVHIQQGDSINIYADYLKYNGTTKTARLFQNVKLSDETALITSDTLYYYLDKKKAILFDDVHITDNKIDIYSDSLTYFSNTKKAYLQDSVELLDKDMLLTADKMDYDFNENIGHYFGNGELNNKETVLRSEKGTYLYDDQDVIFEDSVYVKGRNYELTTDTLKYNSVTEFATFNGNTTIINQGNVIHCESGTYDQQRDIINVTGQTALNNEDQNLEADSLYFEKESGKGFAFGNVFWEDTTQNMSITCTYMEYHEPTSYLLATNDLLFKQVIGNDTLYLTADTLSSQTVAKIPPKAKQPKKAETDSLQVHLEHNHDHEEGHDHHHEEDQVEEPTIDISKGKQATQTINVSRGKSSKKEKEKKKQEKKAQKEAKKNKKKQDKVVDVKIEESVEIEDKAGDIGTKTAQLNEIEDSLNATINDTTLVITDSITILQAYPNARFFKSDFQGLCDSLVYVTNDSSFQFYQDPILWSNETQLTADTILLTTLNNDPHSIELISTALIGNESSEQIYNQLKGDTIIGHFKESQLYKIRVLENAESIYFAQNDKEEYYGVNQAKSKKMTIFIEDEEVQKIKFYKKPEASFFPMQKAAPSSYMLTNFKWRVEERPLKWQDILIQPIEENEIDIRREGKEEEVIEEAKNIEEEIEREEKK